MNYEDFNDYELIYMVRQKDDYALEILLKKYHKFILRIIYDNIDFKAINGYEMEDFIQIGNLSLIKCLKGYRDDKQCSFASYFRLCFENDLKTEIRKIIFQKRSVLNNALSLDDYIIKDDGINYLDSIPDKKYKDPSYNLLVKEKIKDAYVVSTSLSELEQKIFILKINGFNYQEISKILRIEKKQIYRMIQNIKRKIV